MSAAIQRFAAVNVTKEVTESAVKLKVQNFYDEAFFMMRFNDKTPTKVDGGKITHLTGNLYLLEANQDTLTVSVE